MPKRTFHDFERQGGAIHAHGDRKRRARTSQSVAGARYTPKDLDLIHDTIQTVTKGAYPTPDQFRQIIRHLKKILPKRSPDALREKIRSLLKHTTGSSSSALRPPSVQQDLQRLIRSFERLKLSDR